MPGVTSTSTRWEIDFSDGTQDSFEAERGFNLVAQSYGVRAVYTNVRGETVSMNIYPWHTIKRYARYYT